MELKWIYCNLCERVVLLCPTCGNNCCNAGHGEIDGKECPTCALAYEYEALAYKTGNIPTREEVDK